MVIKFNQDWKDLNNQSAIAKAKEQRTKQEEKQAQFEKNNIQTKGKMMKQMVSQGRDAQPQKIDVKTDVRDVRPDTQDAKKSQPEAAGRESAQTKAEEQYQKARADSNALSRGVYKTPEPKAQFERAKMDARVKGEQDAAGPRAKGQQASVKTAKQAAQGAKTQAKPDAGRDAGKKAQQKARAEEGRAKQDTVAARKEIKGKKGTEGTRPDADAAQGKPKGEVGRQAEVQAAVAGGAGEIKAGDKKGEGSEDKKVSKSADKKSSRAGRGKMAHAGPAEQSTMDQLGSLLDGRESPFDAEPAPVIVSGEVDFDPGMRESGHVTYTRDPSLREFDEVLRASREHEQKTIKPRAEKVAYENWDIRTMSISERFNFIEGTRQMVEYAQQIVRHARLPKDPRGYGTSC